MKTLFVASALPLTSNVILADSSWEDQWKNSDLDPRYGIGYDRVDPVPSYSDFLPSLDEFALGHPDMYSGSISGVDEIKRSVDVFGRLERISLEAFNFGNPGFEAGLQWN